MNAKLYPIAIFASAIALSGCLGDTETTNDPINTTLTGQVVDARSGAGTVADPVTDASVNLRYAGTHLETETDEDGRFSFENVPFTSGTGHRLHIEAPDGYMDWEGNWTITVPDARAQTVDDIGPIGLAPAHEVRVQVVDPDGVPASSDAQVVAMETGPNNLCSAYRSGNNQYLADIENGQAVLEVSGCSNINFMVPAHGESDTLPSAYLTSWFDDNPVNPAQSSSDITIALNEASPQDNPQRIASNATTTGFGYTEVRLDSDSNMDGVNFVVAEGSWPAGEALRVVFNYPIEVVQAPHLRYDDMASGDYGVGDAEVLLNPDYTLSGNNTILTIQPEESSLPTHEYVELSMELAAQGMASMEETLDLYLAEPNPSTGNIALVNDEDDDNIAGDLRLILPSHMEGTITIVERNGEDVFRELSDTQTDNIYYVEAGCGAHCGPNGYSASLDLGEMGTADDELTIHLNLTDRLGNQIRDHFELVVND